MRSDLLAADHAICHNDCPNVNSAQQTAEAPSANASRRTSRDNNSQAQGDCGGVGQRLKSALGESPGGDGDHKMIQSRLSLDYEQEFSDNISNKQIGLSDWDPRAVEQPIENEEWVAFLQRSMEEVMDGEVVSLLQQNCVSVFVSPLRNPAAGCRVVEYVACLLSLPFVVPVSFDYLNKIKQVYLDVRVVPNLVYAVKLLMSERHDESSPTPAPPDTRLASTLSADELQTLECVMLMLCRLVYVQEQFLTQFCDAVYIVNGIPLLQQLLTLDKRKARVVADLVAILNNVLRRQPENAELVERVVLQTKSPGAFYTLHIIDERVCLISSLFFLQSNNWRSF